jgi:opacity protein-like surface antigen
MFLAAGTVALLSSPAFADDSISTNASDSKMRVEAQFELLPLGSAKETTAGISVSGDTAVAYGISGAFDYAVMPYLSIGVAPRLVLNVKGKDNETGNSSNEIDLRARIRAHVPVMPGVELFASLYPGYTIVTSPMDGIDSATGFAIGGAVGATYDISPKLFVGGEVGYQRAFTSVKMSSQGQSVSDDVDVSYMHIGLGAGTRF